LPKVKTDWNCPSTRRLGSSSVLQQVIDSKDRVYEYFKGAEGNVQLYQGWRKLRNEEFHELYYP
jgi:hypothetical protein